VRSAGRRGGRKRNHYYTRQHKGEAVAIATRSGGGGGAYLDRAPRPSSLADILDVILDKGIVIDAFVRVSVIGIEILTIDARIVIASVDTYLRFAEAVNRLDLAQTGGQTISDLQEGGAKRKTKGALEGAGEGAKDFGEKVKERVKVGRGGDDDGDDDRG